MKTCRRQKWQQSVFRRSDLLLLLLFKCQVDWKWKGVSQVIQETDLPFSNQTVKDKWSWKSIKWNKNFDVFFFLSLWRFFFLLSLHFYLIVYHVLYTYRIFVILFSIICLVFFYVCCSSSVVVVHYFSTFIIFVMCLRVFLSFISFVN